MKKIILLMILTSLFAGGLKSQEKYGKTLNVGAGVGYYGYAPALSINYEFDIFKNFTLAPFASILTYRDYQYWGNVNYPYRDYYYRETVIPVGVKGTYYFDDLLHASSRWDFYVGTSIGLAFKTTTWETGYYGDRVVSQSHYSSPLYFNMHIGAELHMTQRVGLFLDLSTGLSTFGLGFHF